MSNLLVSIILPAYNAEKYVEDAVTSVIKQTYSNWELLVINDGSRDSTEQKVKAFQDTRIRYFIQTNKGVSAARNVGLAHMQGDYFCFLDADDVMTPKSLESRLNVFAEDKNLSFVDGGVSVMDMSLQKTIRLYKPSFKGYPLPELLKLSDQCFLGNTWMIKRDKNNTYQFQEGLTHGEDLLFYISIAQGKRYSYTEEEILHYRQTGNSAMSNFSGLEEGYCHLYNKLRREYHIPTRQLLYLKYKIIRIMVLSYLRLKHDPYNASRVLFRYAML